MRSAEDLGISAISLGGFSDTALPLNINDSSLSPNMSSLPAAALGWTEMTGTLSILETANTAPRILRNLMHSNTVIPDMSSRKQLFEEFREKLEHDYLRHCDENIPQQRVATMGTRVLLSKIEFLLQQQLLDQDVPQPNEFPASEEMLIKACSLIERHLQVISDELLTGFRWYMRTFFQYHILTYILWYLCINPQSPNSALAFKIVDDSFECYQLFHNDQDAKSKLAIMLKLRAKAMRLRDTTISSDMGPMEDFSLPQIFTGLQDFTENSQLGSTNDISTSGMNNFGDLLHWDRNGDGHDMYRL